MGYSVCLSLGFLYGRLSPNAKALRLPAAPGAATRRTRPFRCLPWIGLQPQGGAERSLDGERQSGQDAKTHKAKGGDEVLQNSLPRLLWPEPLPDGPSAEPALPPNFCLLAIHCSCDDDDYLLRVALDKVCLKRASQREKAFSRSAPSPRVSVGCVSADQRRPSIAE